MAFEFKVKGAPQPGNYKPDGAYGYVQDFAESTISGMAEVFGYDPSVQVQQFRAQNPVAGLTSEMLGFVVPYAGYTKAGSMTRLPQYLERIGNAAKYPTLTGAARNIGFYAPFEAGRTAWGSAFGDMSTEEMLADNALGLALEGAFGGAGGFLRSLGKRDKFFEEVIGDVDLGAHPQLMLRRLAEVRGKETDAEAIATLNEAIRKMQTLVLQQEPRVSGQGGQRAVNYVDELEEGADRHQVNRLFTSKNSIPLTERFGFDAEARRKFLERAGLPRSIQDAPATENAFESLVQYPRVIRESAGRGKKARFSMTANIKANMQRLDNNTFIVREDDSGLFVVAKRISELKEKGKVKEREWVVFKTDQPQIASPAGMRFSEAVVRENAWAAKTGFRTADMNTPIYDAVEKMLGDQAIVNYFAKIKPGQHAATRTKLLKDALGLGRMQDSELVSRLAKTASELAAPRMFQLTKRPLARMLLAATQYSFDIAETRAKRLLYGTYAIDPKKSLSKQVAFGGLESDKTGIDQFAKAMTKDDWQQFDTVWLERWDMDKVKAERLQGNISDRTYRLLERTNAVDDLLNTETRDMQRLTGMGHFKPAASHFLVPHVWEGKHRVFIKNDSGQVVWVVGAETHAVAKARAKEILEDAQAAGRNWSASKVTAADTEMEKEFVNFGYIGGQNVATEDSLLASRAYGRAIRAHRNPRTFRERKDVGGFQSQFGHDLFMEVVDSHVHNRLNYLASLTARSHLDPHLQKLRAFGDTHALNVVLRRLQDFEGKPGPVNKALNVTVDKVLSPVLGKNSGSQIASATNKAFMHLTLGAANVSYSLISALTFMQTVLPHVAFIASAPPARLAPFYSYSAVAGRDGMSGFMGHLNVMRIMKDSFRMLGAEGRKDSQFIKMVNRAANDGTIDPRLIEDYIGQTAERLGSVREAFESPSGFAQYVLKLSEFGMAAPERWSRLHALSTGYVVGRKILGLSDDPLYRFIKSFTDNTMYRYAVPDRPVLFAGPAGSIFGLFKNWMMHYMFSMGAYMGEAARGNFSPLLWQVAGTTAVGGVGAWPFYGLMDGFSKTASDKPLMEHLYSTFNDGEDTTWSDAVYMGLPSMFGISLTTQAQSVFNSPVHDASMMFSFVHLDRMVQLGKAVGGGMGHFGATGEWNVLRDRNTREQLARAVAPKTVYRTLSAATDESIRSLQTGYPLMKDVGMGTRLLYGLGLNTPEVERMFRVGRELWLDQDKRRAKVAAMGEAWMHAQDSGDRAEAMNIMRRAVAQGIPVDSVIRSGISRMQKAHSEMLERSFSPEAIYRHKASLGLD